MVASEITKGNYGACTAGRLGNRLRRVVAEAIHEGSGTLPDLRQQGGEPKAEGCITKIVHGKAKGNGFFAIFATTMKYVLEPQFVDVKCKIDGKKQQLLGPRSLGCSARVVQESHDAGRRARRKSISPRVSFGRRLGRARPRSCE